MFYSHLVHSRSKWTGQHGGLIPWTQQSQRSKISDRTILFQLVWIQRPAQCEKTFSAFPAGMQRNLNVTYTNRFSSSVSWFEILNRHNRKESTSATILPSPYYQCYFNSETKCFHAVTLWQPYVWTSTLQSSCTSWQVKRCHSRNKALQGFCLFVLLFSQHT